MSTRNVQVALVCSSLTGINKNCSCTASAELRLAMHVNANDRQPLVLKKSSKALLLSPATFDMPI